MGSVPLRICRVATLVFLVSLPFPPSSAPAAPNDQGPYLLHLDRGDSLQVVRVEPATFGMLRYVRSDSVEGYLSGHKVRSITDADGRDLGRSVLERRRAIGVAPLTYRRLARRHRSRREDRTFPISEIGFYSEVSRQPQYADGSIMTGIDVGAMRNVARSVSIGATLHFESDEHRSGLGLSLRGRRWFGNRLSLDGAAGLILAGDDDRGAFKGHSYFGEGSANLGDHVQVVARIESWRWARYDYSIRPVAAIGSGTPPLPEGYEAVEQELDPTRETLIHIGGKVGTYQGLLALVGFSLMAAVWSSRY